MRYKAAEAGAALAMLLLGLAVAAAAVPLAAAAAKLATAQKEQGTSRFLQQLSDLGESRGRIAAQTATHGKGMHAECQVFATLLFALLAACRRLQVCGRVWWRAATPRKMNPTRCDSACL